MPHSQLRAQHSFTPLLENYVTSPSGLEILTSLEEAGNFISPFLRWYYRMSLPMVPAYKIIYATQPFNSRTCQKLRRGNNMPSPKEGGPEVSESSASGSDFRRTRRSNPEIRAFSQGGPNTATVRSGVAPEGYIRRRSSTLTQYSLNEASQDFREEIVNPGPDVRSVVTTWKSFLPIVFASIPPVAGLFFHNGTAFFSDLILLFLATVFLHWSVTAPW